MSGPSGRKRGKRIVLGPVPPLLTSVVNYWPVNHPTDDDHAADRIITGGPIFGLVEVQKLPRNAVMIASNAQAGLLELGWDSDDVWNAVKALQASQFIQAEWCLSGKLWFASDAYCIRRYDDHSAPPRLVDVYLKFSINAANKMLMIRCHESTP